MSAEIVEQVFGSREIMCWVYQLIESVEVKNNETENYNEKDPALNLPPDNRCEPDKRGMGVVFFEKMKENSKKIAQIDIETDEKFTYGEVLLRSIRVAQHLQSRGITENDVVSLCTDNHMNSCMPFLASLFLRVKIASLDPTLSQSESSYLLNLVTPKIIFCNEQSEELIEKSLAEAKLHAEIVVFGKTQRNIAFDEFLRSTGSEDKFVPKPVKDPFETAIIFFSSGTTGLPKGICATHYGILAQNTLLGLEHDISVILYYTSFYWISGTMLLTAALMYGSTRLVCRKFDEKTALNLVEKYKATIAFFAPTYTYKLTQFAGNTNKRCDLSSLKSVIVGGGPLGKEQMLKMRKLLPNAHLFNMYGMTETAGIVTMFNPKHDLDLLEAKPTSSGKPVAGFAYRIVDPETEKILGPNQRGELLLKSKCIMRGYYKKPEETKKAWDGDGFLYTGDIAYYDEDYCFYIVDRIKDMLKYQSWHVAPAEIESVILTHPDTKSAVVIGVPHEVDGDLPMAVVVLKPGGKVTENELIKYVNGRLAERKHLRAGLKFVESIPVTPSGKLRRRDVRNWVLNGLI